ncbi:AAA ATPase central domain protein [Leptothrix cholodnii SP-6]|uniref:Replication-associated recombination protein A n=1 Tax=Leptothrix cholodnii (strain ATCC 51168 / LMG 8142 / SP-6) TaxID=395495 RepID=B1Y154_LEPCP|nr:replication-associated recombination protein A [Leptothrix cholodnii]ACB33031.1 AAA ATPase central domain protein [Leptothrix cholodnii SP-6]
MSDLFDAHPAPPQPAGAAAARPAYAPLAERLRPRTLDEVIGQYDLLDAGKPLRVAFESRQPHSMILWGPPGVGKTTLARLMADAFDAQFVQISAVLGGVKEIREAVEQARVAQAQGRRCIVFVDEVHRFNKSQQDAFLPHVESGLFTFIGATTENPSFEVNSALLSRATVHVLQPIGEDDLRLLLERACATLAALAPQASAVTRLIAYADGDARRLLNTYENVVQMVGPGAVIDEAVLERCLGAQLRRYDKGGEQFYDTISALHKSVRGSDPDAALYWFVRMLDGGVDARYIVRRLVRMASEDIGLADPRALRLCLDAAETYERLGSPEGELALAEAVVYLAVAPKSNAVYTAYKAARAFVQKDGTRAVPLHLRNAPTALMKQLDYGRDYRYAHDEADAYAAGERYFPDALDPPPRFYEPAPRGLEIKIGDKLAQLRERDAQAKKAR